MSRKCPATALLNESAGVINKANEEFKSGRLTEAKHSYLTAAELLFKSAQISELSLREARTRRATELLTHAQSLVPLEPRQLPNDGASDERESTDAKNWLIVEKPNVNLADVAGLDEAKEQIRMRMIYPFTHTVQAERLGMKKGGGVLLFGPPGTGKTMLARAIAGEVDAAFLSVDAAEIMSKWVGEAEKNVAKLFAEARRHQRCVIFIDEIEALLPKRSGSHSTVMKRVVPQFLSEMNGVTSGDSQDQALLFIGATNEPWSLDEAAMRPGRFDEKVYVALPDIHARLHIATNYLGGLPGFSESNLTEVAKLLEGYSGADVVQVIERAKQFAFADAVHKRVIRDLSVQDLYQALAQVKPSVTQKMLDRYLEFVYDT